MRCEDYPCCGHGPPPMGDGGGCPTVTRDGSLRWPCARCGKRLPKKSPSALCAGCQNWYRHHEDYDDGEASAWA